jgi:hypothetical protein
VLCEENSFNHTTTTHPYEKNILEAPAFNNTDMLFFQIVNGTSAKLTWETI